MYPRFPFQIRCRRRRPYCLPFLSDPVSIIHRVSRLSILSRTYANHQGSFYADALLSAGINRDALTFLGEHMSVDVAHNKLMELYIEKLVRTRIDVDEVIYAMRVTGRLYAEMIWAAFTRADEHVDFGINHFEAART